MGYCETQGPDFLPATKTNALSEEADLAPSPRTLPAMERLSQRFEDPQLEAAFRRHHGHKTRTLARIAIVLGVGLFASFGGLDLLMAREQVRELWLIRYGVVCPTGAFLLATSFTTWGQDRMQLLAGSLVTVAGLGVAAMTAVLTPQVAQAYYVGMILTVLFGFTVSQLRWHAAVAMGGTIVVAYELVAFQRLPVELLINNNFFLLTGVIIGLIACWELERFHRRDFLQVREIVAQRKALAASNQLLQLEASRDPLTGLQNRRHLEERIDDAAGLTRRYGIPTCAMLLDLDHFKRVNDTLGHPVGDELLQQVARCLDAAVRDTDRVFRIGGDEFLVLLRGTPLETALEAVARIEQALAALFGEGAWAGLEIGASAGVVILDPELSPLQNLEAADRSLYTAKHPESRPA